jgi:hypothetical protein
MEEESATEEISWIEGGEKYALAGLSGVARYEATAHGSGVDCRRPRYCRDPSGGSVGLRHAEGRERDVRTSAKTRRLYTIDVAVTGQNDSCHHGRMMLRLLAIPGATFTV